MLAESVNERQHDWDLHLPHVRFAYNNTVSAAAGLAPNQGHIGRLPRFPMAIFDNIYARRHQSLAKNHLSYHNLAVDRQCRSYDLFRQQHALIFDAFHRQPVYKTEHIESGLDLGIEISPRSFHPHQRLCLCP